MPRGGSSPQVRGTYFKYIVGDHGIGLIPAGAGNISKIILNISNRWAHPRRCGEHLSYLSDEHLARGSSPQVRGTLGLLLQCSGG